MSPRARSPIAAPMLDALPDTVDFRDRLYQPTLIEVPVRIPLAEYRRWKVPVLDQGREGACTGFGLATVAHYLLRRRRMTPDRTRVSPHMIYRMAKRYDEWPGEEYQGSSARGAMKAWHKHGICAAALWPAGTPESDDTLTARRAADAARRPLGAYFRVNHKDLVALHTALAEVGILYVTATIHTGWLAPGKEGVIPARGDPIGGHAFAAVAYDERGFWIQNSWGRHWGLGGLGLISYDDWLEHATDVWVARLGAPVNRLEPQAVAQSTSPAGGRIQVYGFADLRPHIISIGNDGRLRTTGVYGTSERDVHTILTQDFPALTRTWRRKRLLLYAHGGLVSEQAAIQRVADYRKTLLEAEIYPLAFVWKSDYWSTLQNLLEDIIRRRRPEGILDAARDFLLERLDDTLELIARAGSGKAEWDEMKENAELATAGDQGGARLAALRLAELTRRIPGLELHLAGHSAGSIFHAPLVSLLTSPPSDGGLGLQVASLTLWAPAIAVARFEQTCAPAIRSGRIKRFSLFTLTDRAELDDHCAGLYHKSLLYLVSNAFERERGTPILGMEKHVRASQSLRRLLRAPNAAWVLSPNTAPLGSAQAARARHHGDFDDDEATLKATLARILGRRAVRDRIVIHRAGPALENRRRPLNMLG